MFWFSFKHPILKHENRNFTTTIANRMPIDSLYQVLLNPEHFFSRFKVPAIKTEAFRYTN